MEEMIPLFEDEYAGQPAPKRVLAYMQKKQENDQPIVGTYCAYAPVEMMQAMGLTPAILCAFAKATIASAETVLPANLCPLIKSSYGFIQEGSCPFFSMAGAVVAETTCDGKKKMFELAAEVKPLHVMDLPQLPDEVEAKENWTRMIRKLQGFLEETFNRTATDLQIEESIKKSNKRNQLMRKIFDYAAIHPPVINWQEMFDISFMALPYDVDDAVPVLEGIIERLERRVAEGVHYGSESSPRVLVTGSPVGGDALKIYKIIEQCGGVVVTPDCCTGLKLFAEDFEEDMADPAEALAKRYLRIPCSCMTPNEGRLEALSKMIEHFKPDAVIDFVLTACHAYNVESYKVGQYISEKHDMPFLKIETDYSDNDEGQIRTKVQALFEIID